MHIVVLSLWNRSNFVILRILSTEHKLNNHDKYLTESIDCISIFEADLQTLNVSLYICTNKHAQTSRSIQLSNLHCLKF